HVAVAVNAEAIHETVTGPGVRVRRPGAGVGAGPGGEDLDRVQPRPALGLHLLDELTEPLERRLVGGQRELAAPDLRVTLVPDRHERQMRLRDAAQERER